MPNVVFLDAGSDHTQGLEPWTTTGGTVASDTGQAHSGPRSIKCTTDGTGSTAYVVRNTGLWSGTTGRLSIWIRLGGTAGTPSQMPTAEAAIIGIQDTFSTSTKVNLRTDGKLSLVSQGSTTATGSTVLTTGTWYQLTLAWTYTSYTTTEWRLYIGSSLEASLSNPTIASFIGAPSGFSAGWLAFHGVAAMRMYLDDIYCDDGSHSDGYPGAICVTAKLPSVDNGGVFDTAVGASPGAGSRYTNVNERPLSVTNGWQQAGSSQVDESYAIQGAATGDVDLTGKTIVGRMSWAYWKFGAGTQGTAQIWDNGARTNLTGVTSNTYAYHCSTSSSYPSDAAAVGIRSGGNSADTFLYECGMLLAYLPSTAWSQSLSETLSLSDARALTTAKALSEVLSLTDSRTLAVALAKAETLALTDAGVRSAAVVLAVSLGLTDARTLIAGLALSETITFSEARALTIGKALGELLELLDSRSLAAAKALVESLSLVDQADLLLITAAIICYGGTVLPTELFGGTVAPVTSYGGTVAPTIVYGGSVEGCE